MRSWDEVSEFYQGLASRESEFFQDFGNGILDLIQLLKNDPDVQDMYPGTAMFHLLVALPDYKLQSVHIQWVANDTYEIFLTPEDDQDPEDVTIVSLGEAVKTVKEYLNLLSQKK